MTETKDFYKEYEINITKLTRDYIKEPLTTSIVRGRFPKIERPLKSDLEYLYIELNLPRTVLCEYFNIDLGMLKLMLKEYKIHKPKELIIENTSKGIEKKYGVKWFAQTDGFSDKVKTTVKKHKEEDSEYQAKISAKKKQTCLERYETEYYLQSKDCKVKKEKTCLERYGYTTVLKNPKFQQKAASTKQKRYGNPKFLNPEKRKQTCLKKYGVSNPNKCKETQEKRKQTCLEKYGVDSYTKTQEYKNVFKNKSWLKKRQQKSYNTKKLNNSFNSSKAEEEVYQLLLQKFEKIERQYKSELYPFACDFYISEKDLYIECNFHWTHGKESFNKNNTEHINKVKLWKSKNTKFYNIAIDVWTIRDPLKRKTAKENNLNWIEFFNLEEAERWLASIDK